MSPDPRLDEALALAARREDPSCRSRAVALLEDLVAGGAAPPRARFLLASLYDDHADGLERAILHYRAGLAGDPGDAAARNNLAVALMGTGHPEEAVAELVAVLLEEPGYGLAAQNLAQLAVEDLDDRSLAGILARLASGGQGEPLTRFARALADAGRQEALAATYSAGHALKNRIGLAGSEALALARKVPEPAARALAGSLERLYGDWAAFLKSARADAQRREACDLNQLAADVARGFPADERPQLALSPAPALARGDPAALREAILNLARNAREACPRGRVELSTAAEPDGRWVRLCVADEGPGIAAEQLKRIFAPGFTTKPRGSGFGLSIAERIARAEGGRIDVESEPGRGARFRLVLPAASAPPPRIAPRLAPEEYTR